MYLLIKQGSLCSKGSALYQVAECFASTHKPDTVATIMYAMGITQHNVGPQNVRAFLFYDHR